MTGAVIVLGSVNVDLLVSVERLPGAGETVLGLGVDRQLGGKGANQAVAAARAGARSVLLAAVGDDPDGDRMVEALAGRGVDVADVATVPGATGLAVVATSRRDNQIIVVPGANARLGVEAAGLPAIAPGDVCLAQMETPAEVAEALFRRARAAGAVTMLNPAPAVEGARALLPLIDVLVLNETELAWMSGADFAAATSDEALKAQARALGLGPAQSMVLTLGGCGLAIVAGDTVARMAGHSVEVVDTTGAGDCFCGYLAAALARGDDLVEGARQANAAAALSVQASGAAGSVPIRSAVLRFLNEAG
jgi:ribokinase